MYRLIGGIFGCDKEAKRLCQNFEAALLTLERRAAKSPRKNALYLIWKDPWMTVSRDTYISRMLALAGWDTVPADTTERWPALDFRDKAALRTVDFALLASEPFPFRRAHADTLRRILPARIAIELINGEMPSWYGSRAFEALAYLGELRAAALGERYLASKADNVGVRMAAGK